MEKIIAIGDVHGHLEKLKKLFEKLEREVDLKEYTIVFLGDYIDRGPDSKGVIDFIIELSKEHDVITLKGNHEEFATTNIKSPKMFMSWMQNGGFACLASYGRDKPTNDLDQALEYMLEEHGEWLDNLQLCYETDNYIFVHGYLSHELDVEDQEDWLCLWGRFQDIYPHKSGKTVVVGHSVQRKGPVNEGHRICIDTGSFLDEGYITALLIDGQRSKYFSSIVPKDKDYRGNR